MRSMKLLCHVLLLPALMSCATTPYDAFQARNFPTENEQKALDDIFTRQAQLLESKLTCLFAK